MGVLKSVIEFVMDILETIVFIGSLFIVVYLFIMQPNQIKGASMEPTFYDGEYILTSKVTYKFRSPHRGDVVVFKSIKNPDIDYIKRIIGLPGDQIMINETGVYVNDKLIDESYIASETNLWEGGYIREGIPAIIPEGHLFVMGDNRNRSSDSRDFGPIALDSIIGQVFFRYFPTTKMGKIGNPVEQSLQSLLPRFKMFHEAS